MHMGNGLSASLGFRWLMYPALVQTPSYKRCCIWHCKVVEGIIVNLNVVYMCDKITDEWVKPLSSSFVLILLNVCPP